MTGSDAATAASAPSPDQSLSGFASKPQPHSKPIGLERRITYLMLFRVVLISLVLGSTTLLYFFSDTDLTSPTALALFGIIAVTYLLTIAHAVILNRKLLDLQVHGFLQLSADMATAALLTYFTGGAQSAYTFFFPLTIIGAAVIGSRRGTILAAGAALLVFLAVSLLSRYGILPDVSDQFVTEAATGVGFFRALGLNVAAILGVGALAVNLTTQLQRTETHLQSHRNVTADLLTLHADIVRSLSSGLITIDNDHRLLTINQAAARILGVRPLGLTGAEIDTAIPGLSALLNDIDHERGLARREIDIERGDARLVLGLSVSSLNDHAHHRIGLVVNFQDLTELRKMERKMRQAERLAVVGSLAAGVAHEIRNPLASISGSVELLKQAPQADDDSVALMGIVTREIDRLNRLIAELLDYANPKPMHLSELDIRAIARETVDMFRNDSSFADVSIEADIPDDEVILSCDPEKTRQVLWNILRNAAEAAKDGDAAVSVAVARSPDYAEISIGDSGTGVADEDMAKLFDPFFTTKSGGTGLGLAIAHGIVRQHGGDIEVGRSPLGGAEFVIRLPFSRRASGDTLPSP